MALMNKTQRLEFFDKLMQLYPNPECELVWKNHFTLLVAIVLSAQTTDKNVNKATAPLFKKIDSPEKMVQLGLDGLKKYIRSINYFNNKAKSIIELSNQLILKYNSQVPNQFSDLITLSGVGQKTASVFLNVAHHAPLIGVDTHVFRLCHRLNICTGKTPAVIQEKLQKIVPEKYKNDIALALILHGRYTCTAKNPKCHNCQLISVCSASKTLKG